MMMPNGYCFIGEILSLPQQGFLRDAMLELGLTREAFAKRIGAPWETFKKWLLPAESAGSREMPAIAWSLVREVLEHERLKQECETLRTKTKKKF
jgi:hypothetical protein